MKTVKCVMLLLIIVSAVLVLFGCDNITASSFRVTKNKGVATTDQLAAVSSAEDLWGSVIAVQINTVGERLAAEYEVPEDDKIPAVVERFSNASDAMLALENGVADCVITDEITARMLLEDYPDNRILAPALLTKSFAAALPKGSELTSKINNAFSELTEEGVISAIVNGYVGDNAVESYSYVSPADTEYTAGTLRVCTSSGYEPYCFIDEAGALTGIEIDIARAVADRLNMKVELGNVPFETLTGRLVNGKADMAIAGITITEERLQTVDFSDVYLTCEHVIIVSE